MNRRELRRQAREQPFADSGKNYRTRIRLNKAIDFVLPCLEFRERDRLVDILEIAVAAACNRADNEIRLRYAALSTDHRIATDRLEAAEAGIQTYRDALEFLVKNGDDTTRRFARSVLDGTPMEVRE